MPNAGPTVQNVALIQAFKEPSGSFAVDASASLASFVAIPFQEGSATMTLTEETHNPQHSLQRMWDYQVEVRGKKTWTLQFTMPLHSTGVPAGDGDTVAASPLGYLLDIVMGGSTPETGSVAAAGWTAGGGAVRTSDGAGFVKGGAIGWVNTSGVFEARPLANVSGDTLTPKIAFSAAPQENDVIYGAATYYLGEDPDDSVQFAVRGLESQDEWLLMGGQLQSLTINLPVDGTIPTVQFTFQGVDWLNGADTASPASFTDLTPVTYSNFEPFTGQAGRFMVQEVGTPTYAGSTVHVSAVTFEPQITYTAIPSPSGVNGILRWRAVRAAGTPPVQGSFTTFFESDSWWDAKASKAPYLVLYQVGVKPGATVLLEASTVQITDVQRVGENDIASVTVTWKGRRDGGVSTAATDLHYSPLRIHQL